MKDCKVHYSDMYETRLGMAPCPWCKIAEAVDEIDRLNQLLAEAPKFFAPQYDFQGEKLEWLKRAKLVAG